MVRYILTLIADQSFTLLCYILNPLVVLFADKDGNLPVYLKYFGTHDNTLDGDEGWRSKLPWLDWQNNKLHRYVKRVLWLYRNTGYGFSYYVSGYDLDASTVVVSGDPTIRNRPYPAQSGWCFAYDKSKPILWRGWMLYVVYGYGSRCVRLYLGWKFMGFTSGRKMLAFHFNPFMGYASTPEE